MICPQTNQRGRVTDTDRILTKLDELSTGQQQTRELIAGHISEVHVRLDRIETDVTELRGQAHTAGDCALAGRVRSIEHGAVNGRARAQSRAALRVAIIGAI